MCILVSCGMGQLIHFVHVQMYMYVDNRTPHTIGRTCNTDRTRDYAPDLEYTIC